MDDDLQLPDLGGAPMPGEGLDMAFLRSLDDKDTGITPPFVQSTTDKTTAVAPEGAVGDGKLSSRKPKPNIQPLAREDFSAEGLEKMYEEQKRRQLELEAEERELQLQMAAQQSQQQNTFAEPQFSEESFFEKYQTVAIFVAIGLLCVTGYLLLRKKNSEI